MSGRGDDGFSLIEALVALLILSLGLITLFAGLGQAWRGDAASNRQTLLMQQVQSRMEAAGIAGPLVPGTVTGTFADGTPFVESVTPYATTPGQAESGGMRGFWVTIRGGNGQAAGFALTGLKLARAVPP